MSNSVSTLKAVVFDAYGTLFDVHSIGALADRIFPGHGAALSALWRDKQIEYTRLRTISGKYKPFWDITADALGFSCAKLCLAPGASDLLQLMDQYARLTAFPENLGALQRLATMGVRLGILSNGSPDMLDTAVRSAGMHGLFEHVLSADAVRKFKTADEVYALAPEAFGLPARDMLFVSSNCWDAIGATWFGYTTCWINRTGQPPDALDTLPSATGATLLDAVDVVTRSAGRID